jgi:hypothetical protein
MKITLEQLLNLGAAAVTFASAVGLDPQIAMLLLTAVSLGLAVAAGIPR